MLFKEFTVNYKEDSSGNGVICGYASTFMDEPDAVGDVVAKGAFSKSLKKFDKTGKTLPFVWSHKLDELNSYIGSVKATEDEKGLYFEATLDDTPEAQRVRQLYKDGRLSKFSFAYNVIDEAPITLENGVKANLLKEVDIFEVTACLIPCNSSAEVTSVKCSECGGVEIQLSEKSGKRNSKSDEDTIRQAISLLQGLLDAEVSDDIPEDGNGDDSSEDSKEANADIKAEEQPDAINEKKSFDPEKQEKLLEILRNL